MTLGASLALVNEFRLSQVGRQCMNEALKGLHYQYGFEKLLLFGFGYRRIVNLIAETPLGIDVVTLCSSLLPVSQRGAAGSCIGKIAERIRVPR